MLSNVMQPNDSISLAGAYADHWNLSDPVMVAETATAWIYKVSRKRGGAAALKLLKPAAGERERIGGAALDWYDGEGAARVYAQSEDAVLMEWLNGHALSELVVQGKDIPATEILCQIVEQLHNTRSTPAPSLITLDDHFGELFNTDKTRWPYAGRDLLIRAQIITRTLLESTDDELPLHGNLCHENILFSPRSWVAIDPMGLYGDPTYEVASSFQSPLLQTELCAEPERIDAMAEMYVERLGFNKLRILGFAAAHVALSACANVAANVPAMHQQAILPKLISAHEREFEATRW